MAKEQRLKEGYTSEIRKLLSGKRYRPLTRSELMERLSIRSEHRSLVERLLRSLVRSGEVVLDGKRYLLASDKEGRVRYVASQPWTFPSSFMIGCLAEAETTEISIDRAEIEEARWFTRAQLAAGIAGETDEVMVPPPMAIAHHLIRAWLDESA